MQVFLGRLSFHVLDVPRVEDDTWVEDLPTDVLAPADHPCGDVVALLVDAHNRDVVLDRDQVAAALIEQLTGLAHSISEYLFTKKLIVPASGEGTHTASSPAPAVGD